MSCVEGTRTTIDEHPQTYHVRVLAGLIATSGDSFCRPAYEHALANVAGIDVEAIRAEVDRLNSESNDDA
jgi:hypothetical protein